MVRSTAASARAIATCVMTPVFDYQTGSGEDVAALPVSSGRAAFALAPVVTVTGTVVNGAISSAMPGSVELNLSAEVLARMDGVGHELVTRITVNFGPMAHEPLTLVIGGPQDPSTVGVGSPFYAGTLSMFMQHNMAGAFTFIVSIREPVKYLYANRLLGSDGMAHGDAMVVDSVSVESY